MKSFKSIGWNLLATTILTSCGVTGALRNDANPRMVSFAKKTLEQQQMLAQKIAEQETASPQGFVVRNDDFVETKTKLRDERSCSIDLGMNTADSTFYLKKTDPTQPGDAGFSRSATYYMGNYAQQTQEVKNLFAEGKKAADASTRKFNGRKPLVEKLAENRFLVVQHMGGDFVDKTNVNLQDGVVAHFAGNIQTSQETVQENKSAVRIAQDYRR